MLLCEHYVSSSNSSFSCTFIFLRLFPVEGSELRVHGKDARRYHSRYLSDIELQALLKALESRYIVRQCACKMKYLNLMTSMVSKNLINETDNVK